MLGSSDLTVLVGTVRFDEARAFYRETLGLTLVSEDPFAAVFDAHGTTLRLSKVEELTPQPFAVLGWSVADIEGAVDTLGERGVAFERYPGMEQDDRGLWQAPGGPRIAWFRDPDGNTLSLTEAFA